MTAEHDPADFPGREQGFDLLFPLSHKLGSLSRACRPTNPAADTAVGIYRRYFLFGKRYSLHWTALGTGAAAFAFFLIDLHKIV